VPGTSPTIFVRVEELSGLDVHTVTLTSSGYDPAVLGDMYADAEAIAQAAATIDRPVVVVAHSYGGIPATQALTYVRSVRRIIYVAAFQLHAGESLISTNGGSLMSWSRLHPQQGFGDYVEAMTPRTVFYNDVDAQTARRAVFQSPPRSCSQSAPTTSSGYRRRTPHFSPDPRRWHGSYGVRLHPPDGNQAFQQLCCKGIA
jgi:pimeloyl-ACP methyl ester carboxylesterase